jgi:hypothetical protein
MLCRTRVFTSTGICESHIAFRDVKWHRAIFHARRDRCGFHKKRVRTRYTKLVFCHLEISAGHVVDSDACRVQNIDALFFMIGWDWYGFDKTAMGHVMSNLCFCIRWDLRVT